MLKLKKAPEDSETEINILVVEDNFINQEIAKELVQSAGFKVESAENGQIAIEKAQNKKI